MSCKSYRPLIENVASGSAGFEEIARLDAHLTSCVSCNTSFMDLQHLLDATRTIRVEPDASFWDEYYDRLEAKMGPSQPTAERDNVHSSLFIRKPAVIRFLPTWSFQLAAAAVVLIGGIWLGRTFFSAPLTSESVAISDRTAVEDRAFSYLDRSKTLLLGVVNFNLDEDDPSDLNIERRKGLASGLIQEASLLKADLSRADDLRLKQLISDLEIILLQIANIESEYDIPDIELVQNGVDRQAIFFKIDVESMRRSDMKFQTQSTTTRTTSPAI
mgnify:CR=1 FL=1|jgi:hypothetical protein